MACLASCSVDAVDPSPALKQLLCEANHSSLYLLMLQMSAVVTVLPLYVFMVFKWTSLPFTFVLEE